MLTFLCEQIKHLDDALAAMEKRLMAEHRADPQRKLLAGQPGSGPITAQTLVTRIDPTQFKSGRHFAAWLGLTPKQLRQAASSAWAPAAERAMSVYASYSWSAL
jgi:transposase